MPRAVRCFFGILAAALLCVSSGTAAAPAVDEFEGLAVVEIRFEPRSQPVPEARRRNLVAVRAGEALDRAAVRRTIASLFETGRYARIEADVSREGQGLVLTFRTEPNWFIGEVLVEGAPSPPSENQLVNATDLSLGELYTQRKVADALQNLRRLLIDNGFPRPLIEAAVEEDPETQQVDIRFKVFHLERAGFGNVLLSGDADLEPDQLRRVAKWKAGKAVTAARVDDGLNRIVDNLRSQDYWQADAVVATRDYNPDEHVFDFVASVRRGPQVLVRIEGYELSEKKVQRMLPVYEEGAVDDDLLFEGAENLRNYLQNEGYFQARVDYEVESRTAAKIEVLYRVELGDSFKLTSVEFVGARFFDRETLFERVAIQPSGFQFRGGQYSDSLLAASVRAIRNLYLSNGFRDVVVDARLQTGLQGKPGLAGVVFEIIEGRPTFVEQLVVEGMEQFPSGAENFQFSSAQGQPFSESSVATDRDRILSEYFDAGYQDALFAWRVRPGTSEGAVVVEYEINEGERSFVARTLVSGVDHTSERLVRRQILMRPDEPLSQTGMFETQRRLYELGVFSRVDIDLQNPEGDERNKTVLVQLEEARRWTFGFGGGAEFARIGGSSVDITSPVGDASFSPRVTLEVNRINFRGKGQTVSFRSRVSNLQQRALLTYENPHFSGSDKWKMTWSGLWDTSRNVRTFTGRRLEGAVQWEHRLNKASTGLYRYTYRRTSIDQNSLQITPLLIPLTSQPVRAALVSGTYIQDRRDNPTDSTQGTFNSVDLSFASGYWGSQPDFFRFLGQNSSYHRIGKRVVLARTSHVGLMAPWGDPSVLQASEPGSLFSSPDPRIPLAERYFAGGANTHRGFPINQAGPRDPTTGFPIGGGAELLNSVELRFPLIGQNIGGVLFHDAGNVYSAPGGISFGSKQSAAETVAGLKVFDFDYMVHAVGFGLRYRTPIGPVRADLAYSINPPRFIGFDGTREELLMGAGVLREQRISHFQFHFSLGQTF